MSKNKKINEEEIVEDVVTDIDEANNEGIDTDSGENDKIAVLEEENKKLKEDYLRAFADAENTKKRCQQEIEKNNKYAIASFAKNLLAVADNLQRAIGAAEKEDSEACKNL